MLLGVDPVESQAVKQMLMQLTRDKQCNMFFYLDLHAHTCSTNSFLYGNWWGPPLPPPPPPLP